MNSEKYAQFSSYGNDKIKRWLIESWNEVANKKAKRTTRKKKKKGKKCSEYLWSQIQLFLCETLAARTSYLIAFVIGEQSRASIDHKAEAEICFRKWETSTSRPRARATANQISMRNSNQIINNNQIYDLHTVISDLIQLICLLWSRLARLAHLFSKRARVSRIAIVFRAEKRWEKPRGVSLFPCFRTAELPRRPIAPPVICRRLRTTFEPP